MSETVSDEMAAMLNLLRETREEMAACAAELWEKRPEHAAYGLGVHVERIDNFIVRYVKSGPVSGPLVWKKRVPS